MSDPSMADDLKGEFFGEAPRYVKLRTGILNSSWAEEMPEVRTMRMEDWEKLIALARAQEERSRSNDEQPPVGSCVGVDERGDEVDLTIVVADLNRDPFMRAEYQCRNCRGSGCIGCDHSGWRESDSRFVVLTGFRNNIASLCVTRYYEIEEDDADE